MAKRLQHDMTATGPNYTAWFLGVIAAVVFVGVIVWAMSGNSDTASVPPHAPPQTTGSATTAPQSPAAPGK